MYRLDIITAAEPTPAQVAAFKAYASISDSWQDALLAEILRNALLEVGAWEDVSLLTQTLRLTVSERESNEPIYLYRGGGTIASVADAMGNAIAYHLQGGMVVPDSPAGTVVINYTTAPIAGNVSMLMPRVYRYATAVYDGENANTLQKILTTR